jgi:hypothetical protein
MSISNPQTYKNFHNYPLAFMPCGAGEMRGLKADEYAALQSAIKTELTFPVRLSVNMQKYAFGTINITRTNGQSHWTESQFEEVRLFCERHNLTIQTSGQLAPGNGYIFGSALNYVYLRLPIRVHD